MMIGEPSGTAGSPILKIVLEKGLSNVLVVVTRYFGGILLGAGGLTRAYTKGASIALKAGGIVEKVNGLKLSIEVDYDLLGKIQYTCGQNMWYIEDTEYTDKVIIHIYVEEDNKDAIKNEFIQITNGKAIISESEKEIYFKEENRLYKNISC